MYDLKAKKEEDEQTDLTNESYSSNNLCDRSYYKNHFTNDTWSTKTSIIPTDSLL
ncbi:hypothetical protein SAMN02745163_01159 [Clostridium cavendishii DSM 21758]|uniref:Uncharacterized protein n=1 Tax=Clostridium cavendishii DSM 21758 TaxID=1121302 RepID=A0A1M6FJY1_9CLOT|nr:hypothetical protein [Clostridium cavendishii]SHI97994.1 hypothetical protein SAMN02745163_01159 [Clostridium cavendishii DSM 21758]